MKVEGWQKILISYTALLGFLQLLFLPFSPTSQPLFGIADFMYSFGATPIVTTPSILLDDVLGINLYSILGGEALVTSFHVIYILGYGGLAGSLYLRDSKSIIRVIEIVFIINLVSFILTELTPSVTFDPIRLSIYVAIMGIGIGLTDAAGSSWIRNFAGSVWSEFNSDDRTSGILSNAENDTRSPSVRDDTKTESDKSSTESSGTDTEATEDSWYIRDLISNYSLSVDTGDRTTGILTGSGDSSSATFTQGRTDSSSHATSVSSSQAGTQRPVGDDSLDAVERTLEIGDGRLADAQDQRDAGEYERALDTYDEARKAYEIALETAKDSQSANSIDADEIERKIDTIEAHRQGVHRRRLEEEVASLRSDLDHADGLGDDGELEEARERLQDMESDLTAVRETASQHDFDTLLDEITDLERRREGRLDELAQPAKSHQIPDEIPRVSDRSVDYEALTDEEPVGSGGNADVSKATLQTPDGDVTLAIKRPRMAGTLHSETVERLLDEAETWDRLDDHDHIVGVVDYGSEPIPWIAMEYMDGGHLGRRNGEMDTPEALWTAIAVTKGVRHAHTRGVAHLDLKPENVLFRTVEGAWDVPKVADWGLSKHLLRHSKSVEGMSPHYAAPEQFEEAYGSADNVTDVYQLGAVFYELFTGHPPFEGRPTKIMRAVIDKQPTPPSEIADVPHTLDEILLTALAKEKDDRYDDIIYLRDDLQELFDEWR